MTARRQRSPAELLSNLKRAQLARIAVAYAVAAWLVIQVAATIAPMFDAPAWLPRLVVLVAIAGFVATIGIAAITIRPRTGDESVAKRRKYWRLLIGGALLAALFTVATFVARGTGLLFGEQQVSLAVLPFADLSPSRDKAYFAEGVAEEILSTLAAEPGIKVLGRTSARQIERSPDPKAIRASLGVTHLLEGSARSHGDQLRMNVRLIDTSDGSQLWEEKYQGRMADVFTVQDQIAATVVKRLRGTFFSTGTRRQTKATTINAYQTYLAARAMMRNRTEKALTEALAMAEQVVQSDPNYAPGRALVAELVMLLSDRPIAYGRIPDAEARKRALMQAQAAIRLAPKSADGYAALGLILQNEQAIEPLRRAIRLDPSRADARSWLAIALEGLGRHDEALEHYRIAAEIEPLWAMPISNLVPALTAAGHQDEALQAVRNFRRRGGAPGQVHRLLYHIDHWTGDISGAIAHGKAGLAKDPTLPDLRLGMAIDYHIVGLAERAPAGLPAAYTNFMDPFYSGDAATLRRKVMTLGPRLWDAPDGRFAFFHLAARRDWSTLAALYDARRFSSGQLCEMPRSQVVASAIALRENGRERASREVLQCTRQRISVQARNKAQNSYAFAGSLEFDRATLSAFDGNRADALRFLEEAVDRGWLGRPFSSQLADYPQFDGLRGDPRYAAIQRRIDRRIAQERAQVLALR